MTIDHEHLGMQWSDKSKKVGLTNGFLKIIKVW